MNRRNFLRTMSGGLSAAAAVRTFPFRVYGFPTNIVATELLSLYGLPDYETAPHTGDMYRISRYGVFQHKDKPNGWIKISREIDLDEAKRIFPAPFRWQGESRIRRSILTDDGSVVDA